MDNLNDLTTAQTREKAKEAWARAKRHRQSRLGEEDRHVLTMAYWQGCLPKDDDYSVAQWVEDGFPTFL
jgi:hypothetical protein